ncbi:unnamed protein product, partial [Mesorhabditis belari]
MNDPKNLSPEEKLKVCTEIGKIYQLMKTLGQKKIRLTESAEQILRLIADKVTKDQLQFKWDLEAENPGYFITSWQARHQKNHRIKQTVVDPSLFSDSYGSSSHLRQPLGPRNNGGFLSNFKTSRPGPPVKNKGRKNANARSRGRPPKVDSFGFPSVKGDDEISQASSIRDEDSISNLLADEDINDLHDIFPQMPSPPREMLDIIKDDPGSIFNYDSELSMSLPSPGNGYSKNYMSRVAREGSDSSFILGDRKKRFSSDVSLHGRHRRLTTRVEEMLSEKREKDQRKRPHPRDDEHFPRSLNFKNGDGLGDEDDEHDDEDSHTVWCICKKPSDGEMIYCENEKCRIQWFHFECVGLKQAPIGHWFCQECRQRRQESSF